MRPYLKPDRYLRRAAASSYVPMQAPNEPASRPPLEAVLAVALVSFSILAAEVALTRVFSVLFRAPYVFLIVSTAIGGLGFGGLVVQGFRPSEERLRTWIVGLSVGLALALAAPVLLLFALPWGRELVAHAETAVVVALPMATYTVAGMLLALLFRRYAAAGGFLYFVDLAAAAVAAPVAVLLLDRLGGLNTPLALAAAAGAAGIVLALRSGSRAGAAVAGLSLLALLGVLGSNLARPWIDLPALQAPPEATRDETHPWHLTVKPLFEELADPYSDAKIVRTDWSAVSRTDVVADPSGIFYVYTDGDVPTQMVAWDGSRESARRDYDRFIGFLPYRLLERPPARVMAIGSGGGLDVLLARTAGAQAVDAVEINPSIPRVVVDPRFKGTYARVYREPGVRLVVDEGRSFLQRSGQYDVIYFACAKTATTQTSGIALLDNSLYTVEAFRDYWRHLSPGGMLALVTQEGFLIDRLLFTAMTALREAGVPAEEAALHLATARVPELMFRAGPYRHVLLLRKQAWKPEDSDRINAAARENGLEPLFLPNRPQGANGGTLPAGGSLTEVQKALEAQYQIPVDPARPNGPAQTMANLSAVTDDCPFYVDIARGLHPFLSRLLWGAGLATLVVVGLVLTAGARILKADPDAATGRAGVPALLGAVLYFSMLGVGFMLVELALMQRFLLLLGFPTRSLTVILSALLVSGALGSRFSQRGEPGEAAARLTRLLPALAALLVLYRFLLPPVLTALLPLDLWLRCAATALFLFPAGFLMGMPFPTALRTLPGPLPKLIPAFWSVNGVTSIVGSVGTMAVAKFYGYSGALILGAACYVVAWAAHRWLGAFRQPQPEIEQPPAPSVA